MSCIECPYDVVLCGPGVTPQDCPGPIFNIKEPKARCPDDWCWVHKFKNEQGGWTSLWVHKTKPGWYAYTPYRGWHDRCACNP